MRDKSQPAPNVGLLLSTKDLLKAGNHQPMMNHQKLNLLDNATNVAMKQDPSQPDFLSGYFAKEAVGGFNEAEFASNHMQTYYAPEMNAYCNALMAMNSSLSRGEALSQSKYRRLPGQEHLLTIGLLIETTREKVASGGNVVEALAQCLKALTTIESIYFRYPQSVQGDFLQIAGTRIRGNPSKNVAAEFEAAARDATSGIAMKPIFDGRQCAITSQVNNNKSKKKKGGGWIDLKKCRDPNNPSYVPPGWCVFYHRHPRGCNRGNNCTHKHTMWTDDDLANAKK